MSSNPDEDNTNVTATSNNPATVRNIPTADEKDSAAASNNPEKASEKPAAEYRRRNALVDKWSERNNVSEL